MKTQILTSIALLLSASCLSQATIASATNTLSGTSPNPNQYLGSSNNYDLIVKTFNIERMRFLSSNGNIGIGTSAPTVGLQMHNKVLRLTGNANGWGGPQIALGGATDQSASEWAMEYNPFIAGKEGLNFYRPFGSSGVGGNYLLFLANTFKVGVNTNNPTAMLTVNGTTLIGDPATVSLPVGYKLYVQTGILTEKIKVAVNGTANWSDYVFAANYKLMELNKLEKFITENKHLPNIPSAEEVVSEGVDLGEMTSKLLGKIEELTLYIIAQDKKINEMNNTINQLQQK
jgi:hypothetical protein